MEKLEILVQSPLNIYINTSIHPSIHPSVHSSIRPCCCTFFPSLGYPPFYSDDPMTTCRKIVNWRMFLKFPEEAPISPEARDLVERLLCDVDDRLGSKGGVREIMAHPFFHGLDWDNLCYKRAPYRPLVDHDLDTQNFERFEEDDEKLAGNAGKGGAGGGLKPWQRAADPNFIGYTYKNWEAVPDVLSPSSLGGATTNVTSGGGGGGGGGIPLPSSSSSSAGGGGGVGGLLSNLHIYSPQQQQQQQQPSPPGYPQRR